LITRIAFLTVLTIYGLGQNPGYGGLSNTSNAAEQIGVRQPIRYNGVHECLGDVFLTNDVLKDLGPPFSGQYFINHVE
jgi:hypothetical protein